MEKKKDSTLQQASEGLAGTTVFLEKEYADKRFGGGSGFFIAPDKIATNIHVLADAAAITVKCSETDTVYTFEGIVAFDDKNDIAVLKIAEKGTPFPLGDSSTVRKGDNVCLIGYPTKKATSVEGTVHSVRNSSKRLLIDFKPSAGPGYSGGPVLNSKGEVIAVAQSGYVAPPAPEKGKTVSASVLKPLLTETQTVEPLDVWQRHPQIHAYVIAGAAEQGRAHGEYKAAIAHYDTALQLNPAIPGIHMNRAQVKRALRKHDEALADSRAALKLEAERLSFSGFGVFLSDRWKMVKFFLRGLYIRPRMKLADKLKSLCLKLDPEFPKEFNRWGLAKYKLDDFVRAIIAYDIAIDLNPEYDSAYLNRGLAKYKLDNFAGAISDYNNAIELNPEDAKAYFNRAVAKRQLGDFTGTIADYSKIIKLNPENASAYFNRGQTKGELGDYEGAVADYDSAIKHNPKADTYYNRGLAKKELGNLEGAIDDYDSAIKLNPENDNAYFWRGFAKRQLGDCEGAIADYDRTIKLNPGYATAHHNRGYAKYKINDYEGAIADYDRAIKLKPKYTSAYKNRGRAKKALGQHEAAEADFAKATELDSST